MCLIVHINIKWSKAGVLNHRAANRYWATEHWPPGRKDLQIMPSPKK